MKIISEEKINQFLNEYYKYLLWIIVVIIIFIGYFLFISPQYKTLQDTGLFEQREAETILSERQQNLSDLKQMRQAYDTLEIRTWRSLNNILPKESEIYLLFAEMETFARNNNLDLTSININANAAIASPADTKADAKAANIPGSIKAIDISVNIDGINSYENFKLFLDNIENNIRILDVKSMSYSPEKTQYTLSFTTYYLPDEIKKYEQ